MTGSALENLRTWTSDSWKQTNDYSSTLLKQLKPKMVFDCLTRNHEEVSLFGKIHKRQKSGFGHCSAINFNKVEKSWTVVHIFADSTFD